MYWFRKSAEQRIPFYQHAIELDPKFALAYALLGSTYTGLGETSRANENYTRAYELRNRVSEPEKFEISVYYYSSVTGELEKATLSAWGSLPRRISSVPCRKCPRAELGWRCIP